MVEVQPTSLDGTAAGAPRREAMASQDDQRYCADQVRLHDYDHYLCALFAPEDARTALFALHAFNIEVARTREVVTEALLGRIRLQWWRDTLDSVYAGGAPRHQVVQPLAAAIHRFSLSRRHFDGLLDGREQDLEDEPPSSLAALVEYAEATSASMTALALEVLDVSHPRAQAAGRHIGIAWALTGLLRALPFHAAQRRLYLPADRLAGAGVNAEDIFAGRRPSALKVVVAGVAAEARRQLRQARALRVGIPRLALPALLPATLIDGYLTRIARYRYDVFNPKIDLPPLSRQLRLAWKGSLRRF